MTPVQTSLLERFETFDIAPSDFHHADHIRVAFAMLDRYDFAEACARYAGTIKRMAEAAGVPEKYNATMTFAFTSLIAERKAHFAGCDADAFIAAFPDLLDKDILLMWYTRERLTSPLARKQFLLPQSSSPGA